MQDDLTVSNAISSLIFFVVIEYLLKLLEGKLRLFPIYLLKIEQGIDWCNLNYCI